MNRERAQAILDIVGDRLAPLDPDDDTGMGNLETVDLILDEIQHEYDACKAGQALPNLSAHLNRLSVIKNAAEKLAVLLSEPHEAGYLEAGTITNRTAAVESRTVSDVQTIIRDLRVIGANAGTLSRSEHLLSWVRRLRGELPDGGRKPESVLYGGVIALWCELTGDACPPITKHGRFNHLADAVFALVGAPPPNKNTLVGAVEAHRNRTVG